MISRYEWVERYRRWMRGLDFTEDDIETFVGLADDNYRELAHLGPETLELHDAILDLWIGIGGGPR